MFKDVDKLLTIAIFVLNLKRIIMIETIKFKGVDIEINYTYNEEEKESWGNNGGHPNIPESIDINSATIGCIDVMELIEDYDEEIEKLILKQRHEQY